MREEVERALRRIVEATVIVPWTLATWAPRCVLRRLGGLAATTAPATAVRTVVDLAQQATSPSESTLDGQVTPAPTAAPADAPSPAALPIEDYESLAASQVVTRLSALTPEGLRDVRDFEVAHRGRRTIIGKIDQLIP